MLPFRFPDYEVAMGTCLCYDLLWILRLVVNVKTGSSTLWIIRSQHLISRKAAVVLSYSLSIKSQASGALYLLTQIKEDQGPVTNTKFFPVHILKQKRERKLIPDYACPSSHENETKNQKLEPETRP